MNLRMILAVHRATHRIGLYVQRRVPGLSQAEAHILCQLHEGGKTTIAGLHRAFAHKRSTLTSVLDRMEERRLITRQVNPDDRRSFDVSLTRLGASKAAKIHRDLVALEATALRGISEDSVQTFSCLLERLEHAAAPERDR